MTAKELLHFLWRYRAFDRQDTHMTRSLLERLEQLRYETTTESDDRMLGEAADEIRRLQTEIASAKRMIAELRHKLSASEDKVASLVDECDRLHPNGRSPGADSALDW